MARKTICRNCGAPSEIGRCTYCGALQVDDTDLLVAPLFGDKHEGWALPTQLAPLGIGLEASQDGRSLRVDVPSERGLGDVIVPVAWINGDFVNVAASVTLRFDSTPCDAAAGFWLRMQDGAALTVMAWDSGATTVSRRQDDRHGAVLTTIPRRHGAKANESARISVKLIDATLTVIRNGRPVSSIPCGPVYAGNLQIRVQVGAKETNATFSDPVARLLP